MSSVEKIEPGSMKDRVLKELANGPRSRTELCTNCNIGGKWLDLTLKSLEASGLIKREGKTSGLLWLLADQAVKDEDHKRCSHPNCRQVKPKSEFHKNASMPDGLQSWCKDCTRAATGSTERKKPKADPPAPTPAAPAAPATSFALDPEAESSKADAPAVFIIPTELGVYARVERERVYLSQPLHDHVDRSIHLSRARALELGRWLVANLGADQ